MHSEYLNFLHFKNHLCKEIWSPPVSRERWNQNHDFFNWTLSQTHISRQPQIFTEFIVDWKNTNNAHSKRLIPRITVNGYINELFPTGVPHYQPSSPLLFDFQDETKIPLSLYVFGVVAEYDGSPQECVLFLGVFPSQVCPQWWRLSFPSVPSRVIQ